jgi:hypothetical protein
MGVGVRWNRHCGIGVQTAELDSGFVVQQVGFV